MGGTEPVAARELLRRAAEASFEVTAKVWLAGVVQGRSDLLVGKAIDQEWRRKAHSLVHDPRLGRRVELLAEMPLQRANVQPDMHRQHLYCEALLPDDNPKFVRLETMRAHNVYTDEVGAIFQTSEEISYRANRSARSGRSAARLSPVIHAAPAPGRRLA